MALKFITADEAAALVKDGDNIGFSGFTPQVAPRSYLELSLSAPKKSTLQAAHSR